MPIEWLGYNEIIDTFTFRERASMTIPKKVRRRAFSLQIDVEIVSVLKEEYLNYRSIPAYGFYGYAVLVFRDHSEIQVPLNQSRQRIYYGIRESAYVNWYNLYLWRNAREFTKGLADVLGQIGTAVGLGEAVVPIPPCIEWSGFEELPIREVYMKCPFGTQFRVEVSHWEAIYRTGGDECDVEPESKQIDDLNQDGSGKDGGLPPLGTKPSQSGDLNNPYGGLPSPSSSQDLGEFGNSKAENADFVNPDNQPADDGKGAPNYDPASGQWWYTISRDSITGTCEVIPQSAVEASTPFLKDAPPNISTTFSSVESCPNGRSIGIATSFQSRTGQVINVTGGKYGVYQYIPYVPVIP